jgi:uncharacterized membrane protein
LLNFIRMTVLGGIVFLLPFAVLAFLTGKLIATVKPVVEPVSSRLPLDAVAGFSVTLLLAVVFLILVSFLAGFLARTRVAQHFAKQLETRVLGRVPAYSLLKSVSQDFVAPGSGGNHPVVLINFDDNRQLGVKVGEADEGALSIVFVPDSPTPQTGTVLIVDSHRLVETQLTLVQAYSALAGRGRGLEELFSGKRLGTAA